MSSLMLPGIPRLRLDMGGAGLSDLVKSKSVHVAASQVQVVSVGRAVSITLVLLVVLTLSIFASVYAVHVDRKLYAELENLQDERDAYQAQWTQLLLEQGALTAPGRVAQLAGQKLDMVVPSSSQTFVIEK